MANAKISQLPVQTLVDDSDIIAIVDSGQTTTSQITLERLFQATGSTITRTLDTNNDVIIASSNSTINDTSTERGDNAIIASTSSTIEKNQGARTAIIASNEVRISNDAGEGSMNAIIASYNSDTEIEGGFANTMISSNNGAKIIRGEKNTIISATGGLIQYGSNNALIGTNGVLINSSFNSVALGSEGGTISNHRYVVVAGHYVYNEADSGNQCLVAAGEQNTLSSRGGFASWKSIISASGSTSQDEGAAMVSSLNRASLYPWTLHTSNLYSFGRIQSETLVSATVANVQTLSGGLGMVQFTDVTGGNLNLQIDDVRNGEVYHWVIDNATGGSVSVNSTATNTGFAITDNTSATMGTGPHTLHIVVVNSKIVIEGTH